MAKKKKAAPVVRPPTKRQLSRWQKQKRQQRIIFGIGAAVIAAVVILIGSGVYFGWYVPVQQPLRATVLEIGSTSFPMSYFIDSMKIRVGAYIEGSLYGQWSWASYLMDYVLESIQNAELMRQEAEKMGIVVSEAEIDEQLKGHPDINNRAVRDVVHASILYQKLSDEYFVPQLPVNPEQRQILAMLLESQAQLDEFKAKLEAGADFGELAEEWSLNSYTKSQKGDLGFRPREVITAILGNETLEEIIFGQAVGTYSQLKDENVSKQLGYWLVKVTEWTDDNTEARISAMLLGSEEEALMVKARLDAGEDFAELAKEFSQKWSQEGDEDFGWLNIDDESPFLEYVFDSDAQIGVVSAPIKDDSDDSYTTGGYWLVQVTAAENRPVSEEDRDIMVGLLFDDWLAGIQESIGEGITSYLDEDRRAWAVDYLTGALT